MDGDDQSRLTGFVRTLRIIILALAGGVCVFAAVALVMQQQIANKPANPSTFIGPIMAVFAVLMVLSRLVFLGLIARGGCQRVAAMTSQSMASHDAGQPILPELETEPLLGVYQTKAITSGAILEGAALGNLTAFLIEGHSYSLAIGLLLMLGILAGLPTRRGVEDWLEQQRQRVREIRNMAGH